MGNKPDLISLQGELFLAKIVNGVPGAFVTAGPIPDLKLKISSDSTDHHDPRYGFRAKDAVLRKAVGLSLSGTLEEFSKQNRDILFSAKTESTTEIQITDRPLGTIAAGTMINLGCRNLKQVVFKTGASATIDSSKYVLDAVFGTIIFNEAITEPVQWSGTAGVVERSLVATEFGNEYAGLFKGVDTHNGDKVVAEFWRLEFTPETEFNLINEDFGSYSFEAESLMDGSKALDVKLGPFGLIERFQIT